MTALTVTPRWRGEKSDPVPVLDHHGDPIHADSYVRVLTATSWLNQGQIIRVASAQNGTTCPSLRINTATGSSTGIGSDDVELVPDPDGKVDRGFELALATHQLALVNESIASYIAKRTELQSRIDQLSAVSDA